MNEKKRHLDRHWTILILSMAGAAFVAALSGQDNGFDLLNYHFYSGFAFLHKRFGYDFAPAQIQTFHNPLMHVASYWVFAHLTARSAAIILGAIQGLNFYLIFRIAQVLFSEWKRSCRYVLALACAGLGFFGISSTTEIGATYGDNIISIPVLAGLLLVLSHLKKEATPGKRSVAGIAMAGLFVGAAFGLKFTSAIYLAGFLVALPLAIEKTCDRWRVVFAAACGSLIGFLLAYGFWGASLYFTYQNPFFPYLNKIFHSPYFSNSNFLDDRFFPRNWRQLLFYPFFFVRKSSLVSEVEFRDIRIALCYAALVVLAAKSGVSVLRARWVQGGDIPAHTQTDPETRSTVAADNRCLIFLAIFFAVSYASWIRLSSIYRYLAVLELLAPVFVILAIGRFVRKEAVLLALAAAMFIFTILFAVPIRFGRIDFTDDLLRLQIPRIADLDQSVVLMSGYEPIAYIVPSFPAGTRFVRVSSTFAAQGRVPWVDEKIRQTLANYDSRHRLIYVRNVQEIGLARQDMSPFGLRMDASSCYEIKSRDRKENQGYLCGTVGEPVRTNDKPVPELRYSPKFMDISRVSLSGRVIGKFFDGRVGGIRAGFVDILFEINGELMPVLRRWEISESGRMHLGPLSRSGNYRIIGIRDSNAPDPDSWIQVDVSFGFGTR
jgi:hypothetical protein